MNNEQDDREAPEETLRVIYRGMSSERTPERLNQLVLREASRAVRSPYIAPIRWSRPLAWVTVVVVSSAIVLQVADLPGPETAGPHLPEVVERADEPGLLRDERARRPEPAATAADSVPVEVRLEMIPEPETEAAADVQVEARQGTVSQPAATAPLAQPAGQAEEELAAQTDAGSGLAERAAITVQRTNLLEGTASSAAEQAPEAAALEDRSRPRESAQDCSAAERADPAAWYACIERLRESGLDAAADEQLEALVHAFPEFEPPR